MLSLSGLTPQQLGIIAGCVSSCLNNEDSILSDSTWYIKPF